MRVVHLAEPGAELRVQGDALLVLREGAVAATVRLPLLCTLVLHGPHHLSGPALARLLAGGVELAFLTADGRYRGRLEPVPSPAALRRVAQARAAAQPARRLALAQAVVRAKLAAQRRTLRALRLPTPPAWRQALRTLPATSSPAEVLGTEGWATRAYFGALRGALPPEAQGWVRRHRPAPDPINALFSYGYALLASRVHTAVLALGLDPYLGMLHTMGRSQPALVLDLMEEFRAPLVDFTVVRLLRQLAGATGWWEPADRGVRLTLETRRVLIGAFEARLLAQTKDLVRGGRTPWSRLIERQVEAFARALSAGPSAYRPAAARPTRG